MHDNLRIVSDQSESDIKQQRSLGSIKYDLREMMANLLRVQRGAGKDYEIANHIIELAVKLCDHIKEFGDVESRFLADAVDLDRCLEDKLGPERVAEIRRNAREFENAQEQMIRGAMQIIASRLLNQMAQESAGDREFFEGLTRIERARDRA